MKCNFINKWTNQQNNYKKLVLSSHHHNLYNLNQCRLFSCTLINYKKRKSKDEQEKEDAAAAAVSAGFKKTKNKPNMLGVIDVWRNITVKELATNLNKSVGKLSILNA